MRCQRVHRRRRTDRDNTLASIHFDPAQLKEIRGDVGRVESDESATRVLRRTYCSNKNTQIMSNLPTEAGVQPGLWGVFRFE